MSGERKYFDETLGGCRITAHEIPDSPDARITFYVDDLKHREFLYPAYKIWNLAAHFGEIAPQVIEESLAWGGAS